MTFELFGKNELANHAAAGAYGFLLSAAPAFLLAALLLSWLLRSSPETAAELLSGLGEMGGVINIKSISDSYLSVEKAGLPGLLAGLNLLWTARLFALSIQRGLRVVFSGSEVRKNHIRNNLMPFGIELAAMIFALLFTLSSKVAMLVIQALGIAAMFPSLMHILEWVGTLLPVAGLGLLSYTAYRLIPIKAPGRKAALKGALLCVGAYWLTSFAFGTLVDTSRYNLVYGALGSLMLLLVNIYFFFLFFFLGSQLAFVMDSYDALLFSRFRRISAAEGFETSLLEKKLFSSPEAALKKYLCSFDKGDLIFRKGDKDNSIYFLVSGKTGIYLDDTNENGLEPIAILESGSFIGEMAYLLGESRSANMRAESDVLALQLPTELFEGILRTDPATSRHVIESLSERLRRTNESLNINGPEHS